MTKLYDWNDADGICNYIDAEIAWHEELASKRFGLNWPGEQLEG